MEKRTKGNGNGQAQDDRNGQDIICGSFDREEEKNSALVGKAIAIPTGCIAQHFDTFVHRLDEKLNECMNCASRYLDGG